MNHQFYMLDKRLGSGPAYLHSYDIPAKWLLHVAAFWSIPALQLRDNGKNKTWDILGKQGSPDFFL